MKDSNNLIVTYDKEAIALLSEYLLNKQDAWENLEGIKKLHQDIAFLKSLMFDELSCATPSVDFLRKCDRIYDSVEFNLQRLWKFELNPMFFRAWERPGCSCPVSDNLDRYPYGFVVSSTCILHGGKKAEAVLYGKNETNK